MPGELPCPWASYLPGDRIDGWLSGRQVQGGIAGDRPRRPEEMGAQGEQGQQK